MIAERSVRRQGRPFCLQKTERFRQVFTGYFHQQHIAPGVGEDYEFTDWFVQGSKMEILYNPFYLTGGAVEIDSFPHSHRCRPAKTGGLVFIE